MRVPSTDIHDLIHNLNKEEKKKVTIHIKGLGKKGQGHLRLFSEIAKQNVYDEKQLKKSFDSSSFSAAKKRLYDLIVDSLLLFQDDKDIDNQLLKGLQIFDILYEKKLYSKARKEIFNLETLAEKYEQFSYFPLIHKRIQDLEMGQYAYMNYDEHSFNNFLQKIESRNLQASNLEEYKLLQDKFLFVSYKLGTNWSNVLEEIKENPLLGDINQAKSGTAKFVFHGVNLYYYSFKKDPEKILFHSLGIVSVFENFLFDIRPLEDYIKCLLNVIALSLSIPDLRKNKILHSFFAKIDAKIEQLKKKESLYKRRSLTYKARYYAFIGDTQRGEILVNQSAEWLIKQKGLISDPIYFSFAVIHFLTGNYIQALKFSDLSIEYEGDLSTKMKCHRELFKLIIYIECGEFLLLESISRSLYRKFQPNKKDYHAELTVIKMVKCLIEFNDKKKKVILEGLYQELLSFKTASNINALLLLGDFDYITWAESKLKNQPMATILAQNVLKENGEHK